MPDSFDETGGTGPGADPTNDFGDYGNEPWSDPFYDTDFFLRFERYDLEESKRLERATGMGGEFGVQDEDGAFDPLLRVQKNGVEVIDGSAQRRLVNDLLNEYKSGPVLSAPSRTNLGERASNWSDKDTLSKIGAAVAFSGDAIGGGFDFMKNYAKMYWANTKGADKYFHCMANCEATERGAGGEYMAHLISNTREASDLGRAETKGISSEQAMKDVIEDLFVNRVGRQGANDGLRCNDACNWFKPKGL